MKHGVEQCVGACEHHTGKHRHRRIDDHQEGEDQDRGEPAGDQRDGGDQNIADHPDRLGEQQVQPLGSVAAHEIEPGEGQPALEQPFGDALALVPGEALGGEGQRHIHQVGHQEGDERRNPQHQHEIPPRTDAQ